MENYHCTDKVYLPSSGVISPVSIIYSASILMNYRTWFSHLNHQILTPWSIWLKNTFVHNVQPRNYEWLWRQQGWTYLEDFSWLVVSVFTSRCCLSLDSWRLFMILEISNNFWLFNLLSLNLKILLYKCELKLWKIFKAGRIYLRIVENHLKFNSLVFFLRGKTSSVNLFIPILICLLVSFTLFGRCN